MDNYGERFSEALVSEIKAEMGRRDLSSRKLGAMIGESSQYMSMRLDGGNPRTGERVTLNVKDLSAIAEALDLKVTDLTLRAHQRALGVDPHLMAESTEIDSRSATNVVHGRFGASAPELDERAIAKKKSRDRGEDPEP
ncbi:hypothetical protein [Microbacterium sp. AG238]|uniref:hypothetical protein n=1 Tax=Microbacterium sp. AG238 TaxID=2183994 RepID=UPI000E70C6C0|nr:hypothetical protein [Microbacterium sp. AG238]